MTIKWTLTLLVVCVAWKLGVCEIRGHLKQLGGHGPPKGEIDQIFEELTARELVDSYVNMNKPVVLRELLRDSVPVREWTDEYLVNNFANTTVTVDLSKRGRAEDSTVMSLRKFINSYKTQPDYYLIQTLPKSMQQEVIFPHVLNHCDVYTRLQDFVLWFSSGETKSKLHYDNVENLYCQIDGSKTWFMVEPRHGKDRIPIDNEAGAYSSIDVDQVDMVQHPEMGDLDYFLTVTKPGDCIYVPHDWFHQVSAAPGRNMAINIWWAPSSTENQTCSFKMDIRSQANLSDLELSPGEWLKYIILELLRNSGPMLFPEIQYLVVHEHSGHCLIDEEDFANLDSNEDKMLSFEDIVHIRADKIRDILDRSDPGTVNVNGKSEQPVLCAVNNLNANPHGEL